MRVVHKGVVYEIKYLSEILGSFCKATGMHTEAVDTEGKAFFSHECEQSDFCRFIRSQPDGEKKCRESYRRATNEASKWEEPYFFRCHAGLVMWAVPIKIREMTLGSIICGQVLLWEVDEFFLQELITSNSKITDLITLKKLVDKLEIISPERAQAASDMLFIAVNHLLKRNIHELEELEASKLQQQIIRRELEERKNQPLSETNNYDAYLKKERKLLRYIRLGDRTRAEDVLQSLLADLYTKSVGDKQVIRARMHELVSLVSRAAVEGGADPERAMAVLNLFSKELDSINSVEKYFFKLHNVIIKFLDDIFALADKKHLSLVKEARNYIMENHSKQIKIDDVATHLFISPSHLSRLFRKELDCTVNDYLTRVRVEKAVELMKRPELNVAQVAKLVGLNNQSYFAKVFKRFIGVTPLTYKNSLF